MQTKSGSISATNGSPTITGLNTTWLATVSQGDAFTIAGTGIFYDVASVDSNTQITLSVPYAGVTVTGSQYTIASDFTPLNNIVEMRKGDIETAAIFTRAVRRIDQLLSTNQDAGAITSAGIYASILAGITGTTTGQYFFVPDVSEFVLYLNSAGSAVEQLRFASLASALQYAEDATQAATDAQAAQVVATDASTLATAAKVSAEGYRDDALQSANSASSSEAAATQQASIAVTATTDATTQADRSEDEANRSAEEADRSEAASNAAMLSQYVYEDTATGLADTEDGQYFSVPALAPEEFITLYQNASGVATEIDSYPSVKALSPTVHFTTVSTYTLPLDAATGDKIRFTKNASIVPTIQTGTGQNIICAGVVTTTVEYDVTQELVIIFNGTGWEISNV